MSTSSTDAANVNGVHTGSGDPSAGLPSHVAVIMDGNGRWARSRLFPRVEGHRAGAKTVRMLVEESRRLGIRYLTLFSFSTENWLRPRDEVSALMRLFAQYLESERELLKKHQIRLRAIGDLERLPATLRDALTSCMDYTSTGTAMDLILALSYGGRDEIVRATKRLAAAVLYGELTPAQITCDSLRSYMDAPDVPDPDLLIRTSDENRISNFLLWQLAYSEIVVAKELWPEFSKEAFQRCLQEFACRKRRFGLTDEQLEVKSANGAASLA